MTHKIAIVGAGLVGLSTARAFLSQGKSVTLFEKNEIGENTSGIAAGLLHPYVGPRSKLQPDGVEAFKKSEKLIQEIEESHNVQILLQKGLFRPILDEIQRKDFTKAAESYDDIEFWSEEIANERYSGLFSKSGIFIKNAYVVDTKTYLRALYADCLQKGLNFSKKAVDSLRELDSFDLIFVCTGGEYSSIKEAENLPLKQEKGQLLELEGNIDLPFSVNARAYVVPTNIPHRFITGSTREKVFQNNFAECAIAEPQIRKKLSALSSKFDNLQLIQVLAGLRAKSQNNRPCTLPLSENAWYVGGMGTKGLLYHAYFSENLINLLYMP